RLIEQAETLESTANLAGYLYQTAVNEARQRFRSENRRNHTDDDVEFLLDPASARHAGQNDRLERLLEALAQLEPEHAEMLILWSVHGYSDAQIGEMLGKTRGAVDRNSARRPGSRNCWAAVSQRGRKTMRSRMPWTN